MNFPNWQLHRGHWKTTGVRENTMAAFEQARAANCQMIEMDVQVSKDGVPHVFHDFSLKRFFHVDQKVSHTSSDDLSGLNIPTLKEVLQSEAVPAFLNIEIKSRNLFAKTSTEAIIQTLQSTSHSKEILISSFNPMALFWAGRSAPDIPRALIVGNRNFLMSVRFEWALKLATPHFINGHYELIDDEASRDRLISFSKPMMVWTVNDPERAQFYLTRGAKSIISDNPPSINLDT